MRKPEELLEDMLGAFHATWRDARQDFSKIETNYLSSKLNFISRELERGCNGRFEDFVKALNLKHKNS